MPKRIVSPSLSVRRRWECSTVHSSPPLAQWFGRRNMIKWYKMQSAYKTCYKATSRRDKLCSPCVLTPWHQGVTPTIFCIPWQIRCISPSGLKTVWKDHIWSDTIRYHQIQDKLRLKKTIDERVANWPLCHIFLASKHWRVCVGFKP